MDKIKKIISDHHAQDATTSTTTSTTTTDQQHSNLPTGSGSATGGNIANPLSEPTGPGQLDDRGTAHGYGTGVGPSTAAGGVGPGEGAAAGSGDAAGGVGDSYEPGVNTGGAKVVEARMPVEEGNNFPGTNPNPAHNALGTSAQGGLAYPGGE